MTTTAKRLVEGTLLTVTAATYYTAPDNVKTIIQKLTFTNTSTTVTVLVTVYLVPKSGAAGAANTLRLQRSLAPLEVFEAFEAEGHVLETGDFLQAFGDSASLVTIMASGTEIGA